MWVDVLNAWKENEELCIAARTMCAGKRKIEKWFSAYVSSQSFVIHHTRYFYIALIEPTLSEMLRKWIK